MLLITDMSRVFVKGNMKRREGLVHITHYLFRIKFMLLIIFYIVPWMINRMLNINNYRIALK